MKQNNVDGHKFFLVAVKDRTRVEHFSNHWILICRSISFKNNVNMVTKRIASNRLTSYRKETCAHL